MDIYLRIPSRKIFFLITAIVFVAATALLFALGKEELIPQLWIGIVAAILSYWACIFTAERLRLDLFDRRFEIYKNTLEYCSTVTAYGSLERRDDNVEHIENALKAAHESFRGIGYHKTTALFGQDIVALFDELNKSYAYISTFGSDRVRAHNFDAEKYWNHVNKTVDISSKLPSHFKQYMYFGDHKVV